MRQRTDPLRALRGRRRALRLIAAAPLAAGLAACDLGLPGQGPPPRLFQLSPKNAFETGLRKVDWQLLIEEPVAAAGINSTRIALYRRAIELEYYARASWTDRAPSMIQTLVVESFENSGAIVAVGRDSIGLRADFVVKLELREFQAEYPPSGPPASHVGLNAKLVRMPQRVIVGSEQFEAAVPAEADRIEDVVLAFDEALGKVLKDLVTWTLRVGEREFEPRA